MRIAITLSKETHTLWPHTLKLKPGNALTNGNIVYKSLLKLLHVHHAQVMSLKVTVPYIESKINVS